MTTQRLTPAEHRQLLQRLQIEVAEPSSNGQGLAKTPRLVDGAAFAEDVPPTGFALWGNDADLLAVKGEPTAIVGPQGIGKTTLLQRWMLHRAGAIGGSLLGLPVESSERPILYVAADR